MLKNLMEQRAEKVSEMELVLNGAKTEVRAFNEEETTKLGVLKTEIEAIDASIKLEGEMRSMKMDKVADIVVVDKKVVEVRALEENTFLKFVRGEERALDVASNGGVIPVTIANRIIEEVKELSPIYAMSTIYNVGGDLVFPSYDESTSSISATYVDDLTELIEGTGKFTTVKLQNFIVGCLAKVSKSLMNRTDFDLVSFIVSKVAKAIADFLEKELIQGTTGKMKGITNTNNVVTSAVVDVVDVDDLIDLQMAVPEIYQAGAVWIMNKKTFKDFRKLKDANKQYILNKDVTMAFGWELLGKPVYTTPSVDLVETGSDAVFYGDMSGLVVKLAQGIEIQMLLEKFATQHAVGAVGYIEVDSAVIENQKIAKLTVK
ncbi:phage major capsid protein [Clostridium estertheticum]|uniref:phage major capsid protein n=1 Tax=Clostridium estertheticum TaxID=238834 RepID=UPI001C6E08C0|nr:phage major capsid protein [Clostridium estertheticum]MBW9170773.1 phage major capsid protein [Clostridium estertheticum]WLC74388.1 phage major capsid protein [Clostridium estertheticum]